MKVKVGDRVQGTFMGESFTATVQYIEPTGRHANILLGWKNGENYASFSWVRSSGLDAGHLLPDYQYGYWMPASYLTLVAGSASTSQGVKCTRCGEFNPYAVPNQPDSTYKCYTCRQPH